jgi:hypothetical protein
MTEAEDVDRKEEARRLLSSEIQIQIFKSLKIKPLFKFLFKSLLVPLS